MVAMVTDIGKTKKQLKHFSEMSLRNVLMLLRCAESRFCIYSYISNIVCTMDESEIINYEFSIV